MSLFDNIEGQFKTINATGRSSSNDLISITHVKGNKREEVIFRMSKDAMDQSKLNYKDKVQIQFASENTVCRIVKSTQGGSVTLSQQITNNDMSAGIIRITFKLGIPDFLKQENENISPKDPIKRVKYIHEENMIEFGEGQVTFKLKLDSHDTK